MPKNTCRARVGGRTDPWRDRLIDEEHQARGVQRQCSETAERIENCQVAVLSTLCGSRGRCLIDRELYPPKSWCEDAACRREAHVPEQVTFTKAVSLWFSVLANSRPRAEPGPMMGVCGAVAVDCSGRF